MFLFFVFIGVRAIDYVFFQFLACIIFCVSCCLFVQLFCCFYSLSLSRLSWAVAPFVFVPQSWTAAVFFFDGRGQRLPAPAGDICVLYRKGCAHAADPGESRGAGGRI